LDQLQKTPKSFFDRPEGKFGKWILVLGAIGAAWGLNAVLPWLITLMTNTLHAAALAAVITATVFVVTNKRIQTLASYMFKSAMRAATGLVIEVDPIGILRGYVDDLKKKFVTLETSIEALEGQKRKLRDHIAKNEEIRLHSLNRAKYAHEKQADVKQFKLQARKAGRLKDSNFTLQALLNKMEALSKVLLKMRETSDFVIQDMEDEIQVNEQKYAAIKQAYGAFTAAKKIIRGDPDQKAIFDQALEYLADDYSTKVGEIESFIQMSSGFIQSVDLEHGMVEEDALAQFEEWEKKADLLMLGPGEVSPLTALQAPTNSRQTVRVTPKRDSAPSGTFSDLFGDDKD
jgi:hypothetical protein